MYTNKPVCICFVLLKRLDDQLLVYMIIFKCMTNVSHMQCTWHLAQEQSLSFCFIIDFIFLTPFIKIHHPPPFFASKNTVKWPSFQLNDQWLFSFVCRVGYFVGLCPKCVMIFILIFYCFFSKSTRCLIMIRTITAQNYQGTLCI